MAKQAKLTAAQEKALRQLFTDGKKDFSIGYEGSDRKPYDKLVQFGYASADMESGNYRMWVEYLPTESGLQLARELFADPTPPQLDSTSPADDAIPFAEFDSDPVSIWTHSRRYTIGGGSVNRVGITKTTREQLVDETDAMWNAGIMPRTSWTYRYGGGNIGNGHGRKPRNRTTIRQFKAHHSHKVSFTMNGANIEKNTPKAQMWQEKHHIANKVNVPIPTITGAELLQRAPLTLLPKPTRLTRYLERAA